MGNPVVHFEVIGTDPVALQSFYRDVFDWEIGPPTGPEAQNYAIVSGVGERGIGGGIGGGMEGYGGHVTFYVAVDSLEDALEKAESLGGKTMMPPDKVPNGPRIALFSDPEGHAIGLVEKDSMMM
jgi:predicted enzyme related to lactoylglutathione lyase